MNLTPEERRITLDALRKVGRPQSETATDDELFAAAQTAVAELMPRVRRLADAIGTDLLSQAATLARAIDGVKDGA